MTGQDTRSRIAVLLFTDMVDSVGVERRIGTDDYSKLLRKHHQLFGKALAQEGDGKIHMDTGDGFLAEFTTAAHAVNVALLFQSYLRATQWDLESPQVRIGLHQGQLAEINLNEESRAAGAHGKIVGLPVSIANRVMTMAQPGQILMTRAVYDDARQFVRQHPASDFGDGQRPSLKWKDHGKYFVKGTEEPIEVFEVGAAGLAPLTAPPDTEKARRADSVVPKKTVLPVRHPAIYSVALTIICGVFVWAFPLGDPWVNGSYDYLFRFLSRPMTNNIELVELDNESYAQLKQTREDIVDRSLHAKLLEKLAADHCAMVVFDIFFQFTNAPAKDDALARAIAHQSNVVLAAWQTAQTERDFESAHPVLPLDMFLEAAKTNWGVMWLYPDLDGVVRRDWPFRSQRMYPSLSMAAALAYLAGPARHYPQGAQGGSVNGSSPGNIVSADNNTWLRYYGQDPPWNATSFYLALDKPPGYFHDKIVFIGNKPKTTVNDREVDKFMRPYTRWTGELVGGMEIHVTSFLNLINGDSLRRFPFVVEMLLVVLAGAGLGMLGSWLRPPVATAVAAGVAFLAMVAAVLLTHKTHFWFPWLIVTGAQAPCAALCSFAFRRKRVLVQPSAPAQRTVTAAPLPNPTLATRPVIPEYEIFEPPIGQGAFGKVWLARNAIGQWQALKVVSRAGFENDQQYNTEFEGIRKYKPVSEKHHGLLRIELVSTRKPEGWFYYVMELGDSDQEGWHERPSLYHPRTLATMRAAASSRRLPVAFCLQIGITLAEALEFLHHHNLTHRDIKPANVIFVNDGAKLADVGLVTEARRPDSNATRVGTPGYLPPAPETPGTRSADIYSLGMLLYVISTGRDPDTFPVLSRTLVENNTYEHFQYLDPVIMKACHHNINERYPSAAELRNALQHALEEIKCAVR